MTSFFAYDEITWPEVALLPRNTPLVIPLGAGYDQLQLAAALGAPARVGLLPALPFGWHGSALSVPDAVLGALLRNLLDSLRDDGFTQVFALTPEGLQLGLEHTRIAQPVAARLQPARQQRRISGKHNNNGTLCRRGFIPGRRYALHVQRAPHGHSIHAQQMACAIIGLHQRAQRVSISACAHHAR